MKRTILLFMLISFGSFAQERAMAPKTEKNVTPNKKLLALVVGNKEYTNKEDRLQNTINDAEDMAKELESLGFKVIIKTNLSRVEFEKAIDDFGHQLENYETGLFYYSGHGLQAQGDNYLIPVDANIKYETEVKNQAVSLNRLYGTIEGARNKTNIILVDACRNNFSASKGWKGNNIGGFANTEAPSRSIIAFATRTGKMADDNTKGRNGLFTGELLRFLTNPGLTLRQVLDKTTQSVKIKSDNKQEPVRFDSLEEDIYLAGNSNSNDNRQKDEPKSINTDVQIKKEINEGEVAFHEKNYEKAFRLLSPLQSSEYFSPQNQYQLGRMYMFGEGVEKNIDYAFKFFRISANKNNPYAQHALGYMYANGQGVEKDEKIAIMWYNKATEQGHIIAQNNLGAMYENGLGVEKDEKLVVLEPSKAAEQENPRRPLDGKSLYGNPGKGGGSGASIGGLSGWNKKKLSLPNDGPSEEGKIIFKVTVDDSGDVLGISMIESTVSPAVQNFYKSYIQQKLSSVLTPAGTPPPRATGTITINIRSGN